MRGHIAKRGKNSYAIVINLGRDPGTGKCKQKWVTVRGSKKEAERRLSELLHQLDTGVLVVPSKTTVAEFLERWLEDYVRPKLSLRGAERYESIVRTHLIPSLGNVPLTQLKPDHLQRHYAARLTDGLSPRTIRYHHTVIHKALQTALKWGLLGRNVADGADVPRAHSHEMQTWDEDEVETFLEAVKSTSYYTLFYTALFTGMRRSELLALRWKDVDLLLNQIYVQRGLHHLKDGSYAFSEPKSAKSRRTIALPPSLTLLLTEHYKKQRLDKGMLSIPLTDDDLVFSTPEGKPLRPNTVSRAWTTLAARAHVRVIRLHDARHTHASLLLKKGIHPKIVQERLGHSSIQTTLDTYSHTTPGLQQAAAARFDEAFTFKYNDDQGSARHENGKVAGSRLS